MTAGPSSTELYELWLMMRRVTRLLSTIRSRELSRCGLSMAEAGAMAVIHANNGRATPGQLSRQMLRQPHSISELVARMHRRGLVQKTPDERRKNIVRLSLTERGYELYWKALTMESITDILSALPEDDRRHLWSSLRKLRHQAEPLTLNVTDPPV